MTNLEEKILLLETENLRLHKQNKLLENRLAMANIAFSNIIGKSLDGIVILNRNKMVVYANQAAVKLFDKNIFYLLVQPLDLSINLESISNDKSIELKIDHENGNCSVTEVSVINSEWKDEIYFIIIFKDITERKNIEKTIEYKLNHDHLTNLPNRALFDKKIIESIKLNKDAKKLMGLLYIDIDNFKEVNDNFGHDKGDMLLKIISDTLKKSVRTGDTVARLGGDEFAIIINLLNKPEDTEIVAKNILINTRKISESIKENLNICLSIGIAIYPTSANTPSQLVKNADIAMYYAKNNGKNQYKIYSRYL